MKTIEGYTYRVNEHIGKGYSSTVHKGINDKNGNQVSIKVIQMAKLEDPINQMLLQLEVTALRSLAGTRHVLHLHDVYATKNNTYIITELCEGDLNSLLKQRKTFPYFQVVEIMRQLIQGYYDIYQAGFVHRDIKPANIFHKNGIYKYGDFGFAIPIADLNSHKHYNVGSPVYMPPEALKENNYTVSCDIWAIGIIFYQLLKGVVPWRAISEQVLYEKIINESLDSLTHGLPEPARRFLGTVLSLDVRQRPTPQQLLSWPAQLQAANIEIRHFSPLQQKNRNSNNNNNALRQIPCNTVHTTKLTFNTNAQPNYQVISRQNKQIQSMLNSKIPDANQVNNQNEVRVDDGQYKDAYFFANNSINYIKFLHRVLKFVVPSSSSVDLTCLANSITKLMFRELDHLKNQIDGKEPVSNINEWGQFIRANKCQIIRKKIKKYQSKYNMFYSPCAEAPLLETPKIYEGITALISYLDIEGFIPKLVVAADYLTTLYQLLHLRSKYQSQQFMKISKIDLIMQGNPYNTSPQHFQKLKKKLLLIRP